jgi:hypothetical protein
VILSWSWYPIEGPIMYSVHTPFYAHDQTTKSQHSLKDDMREGGVQALEMICAQDQPKSHTCRGQLWLQGQTLPAYIASTDSSTLPATAPKSSAPPSRPEGEGTMRPTRHDGGILPEFDYICEVLLLTLSITQARPDVVK